MLLYIFLLFCTFQLTQAESKTLSYAEQKPPCVNKWDRRAFNETNPPPMPTRTEWQNEYTEYLFCLLNLDVPAESKASFRFIINAQLDIYKRRSMMLSPFKLCLDKLGYSISHEIKGQTRDYPACILSDEEFWRVEKVVRTRCDKEAWRDFIINSDRIRTILCGLLGTMF